MSLELLLAPVTEYNTVSKPHSLKDPRFIQEQLYSPNEDATLVKPKKYNPVAKVINRLPVYQNIFKPKRTTDTNAFRTAFREQFALKQEAPTFIGWSEEDKFRWLINATTRQLESVRPENYFGVRLQTLRTQIEIDGDSIEYIAYDFDYREKIYIAYKTLSGALIPKPGESRSPIDPGSLKTIWLDKLTYVPVPRSSLNRNLLNAPRDLALKRFNTAKEADDEAKKRALENEISKRITIPDQPKPDQPKPGQEESDEGPNITEIDEDAPFKNSLPSLTLSHFYVGPNGFPSGITTNAAEQKKNNENAARVYIKKALDTILKYIQYIIYGMLDRTKTPGLYEEAKNEIQKVFFARYNQYEPGYSARVQSLIETNNLKKENIKDALLDFCKNLFFDTHMYFKNAAEYNPTEYVLDYYNNVVVPIVKILDKEFDPDDNSNNINTIDNYFQPKKE